MPAITGNAIAKKVFSLLNVYLPGESVSNNDSETVREALNDLLNSLQQRTPFIPVISRNVFALVANQGGPTNPYTIGVGGNFNVTRPSNQNSITAANLILTNTSPNVRVPLGIYSDDAYDNNFIPDLSNTQPTGIYYNPTWANDLGSVFLWPVPTTNQNTLELFLQQEVAQFADMTTVYYVPDAWPLMLKYNVADLCQVDFGRTLSPAAQRIAVSSMGTVKRSNLKISDLPNDAFMFSQGRSTLYNIQSGSG